MKHLIKLGLIITAVIVSVFALKYTFENGVEFERSDGEVIRTDSEDNTSPLGVIATDFKHFTQTMADLIGYTQGKQSEENGLSQLRADKGESTNEDAAQDSLWDSKSVILDKVELLYVVDGDTAIVKKASGEEIKVRFIRIDTPESVNQDESKNNEYGIMASDHTKELLNGVKTLYLEYDAEMNDEYGRTLAYIWMSEDTSDAGNMLNAKIIADGYAREMSIEPNTKYSEYFKTLRKEAEDNGKGLWKYDEYKQIVRDAA